MHTTLSEIVKNTLDSMTTMFFSYSNFEYEDPSIRVSLLQFVEDCRELNPNSEEYQFILYTIIEMFEMDNFYDKDIDEMRDYVRATLDKLLLEHLEIPRVFLDGIESYFGCEE